MKKIFTILLVMMMAIAANAEISSYRTYAFYTSQLQRNGYWTDWYGPQSSDMIIKIDDSRGLIAVYSPQPQLYQLTTSGSEYRDSDGSNVLEFKAVDQDGDRCTIKLMQRPSGRVQIYIIFGNVRWCYDIR